MRRKFFGQYLIEIGEVTAEQVREAVTLMDRENPVLGEFAVRAGFLTERDASRINREQRRTDRKFGDLAISLNLLSKEQLRELLEEQSKRRLTIGKALCRLGALDLPELEMLHERFVGERAAASRNRSLCLPKEFGDSQVVDFVIDLLPKLAMRIARIQVHMSPLEKWSGFALPNQIATVTIRSAHSWSLTLGCDYRFASKMHAGFMGRLSGPLGGQSQDVSATMLDDCVGEFLNILAGNAMDDLEQQGIPASLEPPTFGETPPEGHYAVLEASHGEAILVVSPA